MVNADSRLDAILNTAVEGIITIDDRGTIESINPAGEKLFGYTADELIGRNVSTLMPSPYHDEHDGYLANYRHTGVKKIIGIGREVIGKRKDGTQFPMDLSVSEFKVADKRMFAGFVRDLSERQRSEEIEQSLGRIVEESLNEIFIFDSETLKFVQVNRGARENIGYSMNELQHMTPVDIEPEYSEERFAELVAPLVSGKVGQLVFETVHRRKDCSHYDVEIHLQTSRFQGKPCFVAIIMDITERKEAVEALARLNDELEHRVEERNKQLQEVQEQLIRREKLAVLGQLAGGVAHEIRNPLGVVKNAVYFLQQVLGEGEADINDAIGEITRGVASSERIVSELLDFARGSDPELSVFPLDEAVHVALEMVKVPASISVIRPDPTSIHLNADRGQIERLLANLIQNAVHAMADGGSLSIQCQLVDGRVVIRISDTGKGIATNELEKIFEPLFTKRAKGIGLGLPLCRRYAGQNNGTLAVESEFGKGSTFTVTLPVATSKGIVR